MIQLSDHFTFGRLLRFTLPSIVMMVFTSVYGVVDGFFVSNFAGKTPFAAVNFIMPFLMILGAFGFMIGAGGSALIAKTLGEGNAQKAKELFSLFVYVTLICGVIIAVLGIVFIRPITIMLGADESMVEDCVLYGRIILIALPMFMLQNEFQTFFVVAEKPNLGLMVTIAAGVTNMVLDGVFVGALGMGLVGAASATAVSQFVGGIAPVIYFLRPNGSLLRMGKTAFDIRALTKACSNGVSELLSNVSMSIVSMLYNYQLMKYAGEDGVAAYGVLMYVNFIFFAIFIGYSVGSAPIIGFDHGAKNYDELKNIRKKSIAIIAVLSLCMFALAELSAKPLADLFVGYDASLNALTLRGFLICSFMFIFAGISVFGSSFFTALGNGLVSAVIAFLRTMVFQIAAVLVLPLMLKMDGIWLSIVVAEAMSAMITVVFLLAERKRYNY